MGYKTISMIATDPQADAGALYAACSLAEAQDAHLDVYCLGLTESRVETFPIGTAAVLYSGGTKEAQTRAKALQHWAEGCLANSRPRRWVEPLVATDPGFAPLVVQRTRCSDLILAALPGRGSNDGLRRALVETELFETGAPVLVVPAGSRPGTWPVERVVVAWDDSREALRAVRAAMPLLEAAGQVDIVVVDPERHGGDRIDPGGPLSLMLARHGISAEVSVLARTLPRVAEVLARFALDHGADLMVMGSYGHGRLREAVFGGVTRDMMDAATLPLLMAH